MDSSYILVEWQNPSSVAQLEQSSYENYTGHTSYIVDWRVNKGDWHYDQEVLDEQYISDFYPEIHQQFSWGLSSANGTVMATETRIDKIRLGIPYDMSINDWLTNNSIEFRVRYMFKYWGDNLLYSENIHSPFSNTYQLGTTNQSGIQEPGPTLGEYDIPVPPSSLDAPQDFELSDDTSLYFKWTLSEEMKTFVDLKIFDIKLVIDWKLNDGEWSDNLEVFKNKEYNDFITNVTMLVPYEDGTVDFEVDRMALDIPRAISLSSWFADKTYQFKARYVLRDYVDEEYTYVISPYSNTITVGRGAPASSASDEAVYKGASDWAIKELDKAAEHDLITKRISGNMRATITREELCEVVIRMYEKIMGESDYSTLTDFSDTRNPEIYKAYELGIVNGFGDGKFGPTRATNREEVASMIYRTIKLIAPNSNFSLEGAEKFADEEFISSWALEPIKFMSKSGILKGSNGYVDPKGTTTREQAVLMALRTYEKYGK